MTFECAVTLAVSLVCYLGAALFFQGAFLLQRPALEGWGRWLLVGGMGVHAAGIGLHLAISRLSPLTNMLTVISLFVIGFLLAGLLLERCTRVRHLGLLLAPLAFLGLLYPVLMPVEFEQAESLLLHYPWLGVHVALTLVGHVGFALAFCGAVIYLWQARFLKQGRLNRYLPALDTASSAVFGSVGAGFFFFTLGLLMGVVWLYGAPGEFLTGRDTKIWMAVPAWVIYAAYLYLRGVRGLYGSRLKWMVIAGFALVLVNLLGVRHDFEGAPL